MTSKLMVGDVWHNPKSNKARLITSMSIKVDKGGTNSVSYADVDIQDVSFGCVALINDTTEKTCNQHTFSRWAINNLTVDKIYVDFEEMLRLYKEAVKK